MTLAVLLLACGPAPDTPIDAPSEAPVDVVRHTRRAALALTGAPPTPEALAAVEEDADALDDLVDGWLQTDTFVAVVQDAHARDLGLLDDRPEPVPGVGALEGVSAGAVSAGVRLGPVQRVGRVLREDLPYTSIFDDRSVWVDDVTAPLWGVDHAAAGVRWQEDAWPDGRGAGGLVADGSLHLALGGSATHRAAVLARFLVCDDLDGDHDGDPSTCAACHATLDPLADVLGGLAVPTPGEVATAHDDGCPPGAPCYPLVGWRAADEVAGAWYGTPVTDLRALGAAVAADPRFARCAVERTWADLVGQPATTAERDAATERFGDALDLRTVARDAVLSDALASRPDTALDPQRSARFVHALTGFTWMAEADEAWGDVPALDSHRWGVAGMWEGPSGAHVRARLAEEAAGYAVAQAAADPTTSMLFPDGLPARPDDATLRHLHAATLGELDTDVADTRALWEAVDARAGADTAWSAVVAALLEAGLAY